MLLLIQRKIKEHTLSTQNIPQQTIFVNTNKTFSHTTTIVLTKIPFNKSNHSILYPL